MPPSTLQFPGALAVTPHLAYRGANLQRSNGSHSDHPVDAIVERMIHRVGFQSLISFRNVVTVPPGAARYKERGSLAGGRIKCWGVAERRQRRYARFERCSEIP
jgi:hypothetical protein